MKFTYVLALVLVFAVVAMAAKPNKADRKADRQAKKKCKPFTYTYAECTTGNMAITMTPADATEGCQPETYGKPCVEEKTFTSKKNGCTTTKKIDRTACGVSGNDPETAEFTITLTRTGCTKSNKNKVITRTGLCKTGAKAKVGKGGKNRKGGKGSKKRGNRRAKKTQN